MSVVHIGWSTVERRVLEFANTASSQLTFSEFNSRAERLMEERVSPVPSHVHTLNSHVRPL